jgi:hypothetical protein
MQGALLALHPFLLASPNAVEPSLSVFSPQIFHLQTIIMIYIVTACEELFTCHGSLYRSSIRVVDVNALPAAAAPAYSTVTLSSSSAIRLAL